jgi:hypothetical protein
MTAPYVGGVAQRRKPEITFYVSESLATLCHLHLGSFSCTLRVLEI